jgi:hypothetical protein
MRDTAMSFLPGSIAGRNDGNLFAQTTKALLYGEKLTATEN